VLAWQIPERASVRLAARETTQEQLSQQRYNVAPVYYPPVNMAFGTISFQPPPQAQKRPPEAVEDLPAAKSKKAKTKPKSTTDGVASMSG
jgi:[histone H3]-dimethyl-L-lysine9 demethylase